MATRIDFRSDAQKREDERIAQEQVRRAWLKANRPRSWDERHPTLAIIGAAILILLIPLLVPQFH